MQSNQRNSAYDELCDYLERRLFYFYNICRYDMKQWNLTFYIQWTIMTLQLIRFLSDAYIHYHWNGDVARVMMTIASFVTEIPLVSAATAYVWSACICVCLLLFVVCTAMTHHWYGWTVPLRLMRPALLWYPVFYFPLVIPHLKMFLPCLSHSPDAYVLNPFYSDITCWSTTHILLSLLSICLVSLAYVMHHLTTACFYDTDPPRVLRLELNAMNSKYTATCDITTLMAKSVLLVLYIAGHTSTWRVAMGILTLLAGVLIAVHLLFVIPHWHDISMLLHVFQAYILAWTGVVAFLMVAFDDTEGTGMLYFVILPVLLLAAQMTLQWRIRVVDELSERELTRAELVLAQIRSGVRTYTNWMRQFGDIYMEHSPEHDRALGASFNLTVAGLNMAQQRFPDCADVHIYSAMFYLAIALNRAVGYGALFAAEKAPNLSLDNPLPLLHDPRGPDRGDCQCAEC